MANMNIGIPKFYTDLISHRTAHGTSTGSIISGSNLINFETGTISDLHDGRPLNQVTFDTTVDSGGDHVLLNYDMGSTAFRQNYVAILNHNLNSCSGKIRIFVGTSAGAVDDVDGSSAASVTDISITEVVNADTISLSAPTGLITPASDGTTIFKITANGDLTGYRYWGIQFEGDSAFDSSTKLSIGNIMIGEAYEMPHAPDIELQRSIIYDKVKVQESAGGQRYGIASSYGRTATSTSKSPFSLQSSAAFIHSGRLAYTMNFSYLDSTDVMPDEYHSVDYDDDSFVGDVWNITDGPTRPFIFCIDKSSTGADAESEYIFARFAQNSLTMNQVAINKYNINLSIEEEF